MKFLIAIEPGDDTTAYGVMVPDVPGCFSAGDTLEEAFVNAVEAIDGHVEAVMADGGAMPLQKPANEHFADPDYAGVVWGYVDVPVEKHFGPAERINITIPARVLEKVDAFAKKIGDSRSGFIVRAAQAYISSAAPAARSKPRKRKA